MQLDELMRLCAEKYPDWAPQTFEWFPEGGNWVFIAPHTEALGGSRYYTFPEVARAAFLWHWQQRIDADDMNTIVIKWHHKEKRMVTAWVEEFPESDPKIHEHTDRDAALAAYVAHQIGASDAR